MPDPRRRGAARGSRSTAAASPSPTSTPTPTSSSSSSPSTATIILALVVLPIAALLLFPSLAPAFLRAYQLLKSLLQPSGTLDDPAAAAADSSRSAEELLAEATQLFAQQQLPPALVKTRAGLAAFQRLSDAELAAIMHSNRTLLQLHYLELDIYLAQQRFAKVLEVFADKRRRLRSHIGRSRLGGGGLYERLALARISTAAGPADLARARVELEEACALHPGSEGLQHALGVVLLTAGNWSGGLELCTAAWATRLAKWPVITAYGYRGCSAFGTRNWRHDADHRQTAGSPSEDDPEVLLGPAMVNASAVFGQQPYPYVRPGSASTAFREQLAQRPMSFPEMEVVTRTLRHAVVEAHGGLQTALLVHANCRFEAIANLQVHGLPSIPSAAELAGRTPLRLERAVYLHWLPGNYYHFVAEVLPKVAALMYRKQLTPQTGRTKLLVPNNRFAADYLAKLGFTNDDVVLLANLGTTRLHIRELLVVDFQLTGGVLSTDRLSLPPSYLATSLRAALAPPLALVKRRSLVYVRRGPGNSQRGMLDDHLLQQALRTAAADLDLEYILFDDHKELPGHDASGNAGVRFTVEQQIGMMRGARVIVGPHGAGLVNCMWAGPGTALVEFPVLPITRTSPMVLAAALDIKYWLLPELNTTLAGSYQVTPANAEAAANLVRWILAADKMGKKGRA